MTPASSAPPGPAADRLLPSLVRAPRQRRSQATVDRILAATADLLKARGFAEITVAEIVEAAGVAVGSFYARFQDKDAVLHTLEQQMRERAHADSATLLAPEAWAGVSAAEFVRRYVLGILSIDDDSRALLRAFALHAQSEGAYRDEYLRGRTEVLNDYRAGFIERLLERADEVHHPDPRRAAATAFDLLVSVTEQRLFLALDDLDDDEFVRVLLSYLGLDTPTGKAAR